ncbi:MAG: DNA translocase FtsK 4TM domain-containing protein [Elusimicrobia bacterium]|nr:DNA translocase FtsK 4TM domain-containing protein [Elusimicrobiota bacterium]
MSPYRFKLKRKKRGETGASSGVLFAAVQWVVALFGSAYLAWVLLWPAHAGKLGLAFHDLLFGWVGNAAYLLLPLVLYGVAIYFKVEKRSGYFTWAVGSVLSVASTATILAALGGVADHPGWGGLVGMPIFQFLKDGAGTAGAWLVSIAAAVLGLQTLFEISWREAATRFLGFVAEDYKNWIKARQELKQQIQSAAGKLSTGAPEKPRMAPPPAAAIVAPPAKKSETAAPAPAASHAPPAALPPRIDRKDKSEPAERAPRPKAEKTADAGPFQPPSLQLLSPKPENAAMGPDEAEIRDAVETLNRTLASFDIQAHVSGYSPGPVITRYEVSPSPGVTVSSIVARSNDIALAMKARGIRMAGQIPGKAAIGIEIPNNHSAGVTLREVLESKAMAQQHGALAFAMGLSSDGAPVASDLQKLPHLLVAGATNSGKSVMTHAIIQSILFRSRPDEVKFLLIDPKRIELSLYEGIPHLYDPKTSAENVGVVTHSKDAARSLKALLLVMENRYEKFQAYKVRDIEAFNKEARKLGRPPEFYIVVVIDELADLMVVARDVVEDSIQRLAQMARAVGIHLILATQRPSVDVITGVIKANLPARIALRVASKVDSKVIMDGNGAEALLGKGDMLYMAPGQEPVRIQAAYVSTEEIGRVVDYLKTQGKPEYLTLASMAAVGEEDLTKFGVEPVEFTQALELVLERRRVSQDLLKSQFGSSARATNLLSLLEVKKFIHKPEGTNRWEIDFGMIEDYLKNRSSASKSGSGEPPSAPA